MNPSQTQSSGASGIKVISSAQIVPATDAENSFTGLSEGSRNEKEMHVALQEGEAGPFHKRSRRQRPLSRR
jgi:hypothetical protein